MQYYQLLYSVIICSLTYGSCSVLSQSADYADCQHDSKHMPVLSTFEEEMALI